MHRFWEPIVKPIFEILKPTRVLEIGGGYGEHSEKIIRYCQEKGGKLDLIDTIARPVFIELQKQHKDVFNFYCATSLQALPEQACPDIALIDGDHNYYTVFKE